MTISLSARAQARRAVYSYPALPAGWQRDPFVQLVERVAPALGIGRAATQTFARLAAMTRPVEWTTADREPCVYAAASEVAKIVGLSNARLRAHCVELAEAGLIERRTAANGSRSRLSGTGLIFSCAIARHSELIELDTLLTAERVRAIYLRGQRSTHRRCLSEVLEQLRELLPHDDERLLAIRSSFEAWPRADALHRMPLAELEEHESVADSLCRNALDLLENLTNSDDQPLEIERPHIQDTKQDLNVVCNASANGQGAGKPAQDNDVNPPPTGGERNSENKHVGVGGTINSEFVTKISSERLYRLASPEMQLYLDGRSPPDCLRLHDFIWAAERRLPELAINHSAWVEACSEMGMDRAAMSMLILDARRTLPGVHIATCGGYLRAMTRAHRDGLLNLMGSLIGLSEKRKAEVSL